MLGYTKNLPITNYPLFAILWGMFRHLIKPAFALFIACNGWTVAYTQTPPCPDSSFVKTIATTNLSYVYRASIKMSDGATLLGGSGRNRYAVPLPPYSCVLTKIDSLGNHIWSRIIKSDVTDNFDIEKIKELSDGSIIITGWHANRLYYTPPVEYDDFFVAKLTPTGDLIWLKTFHSNLNSSCTTANLRYASVTEGANGDLLLAGTIWNCPYPKYLVALKLNSAGILQWQYAWLPPGNDGYGVGIFYEGATVTLINKSGAGSHIDLLKLDYNSGNLLTYKGWVPSLAAPFDYSFTNRLQAARLANGNYCVYGTTLGVYNSNTAVIKPRFAVLEFDTNLNFVNGYAIKTPGTGNPDVDMININPQKRVVFTMYNYLVYPDVDIYIGSIVNAQVVNQRKREYRSLEVFNNNTEIFGDGSFAFMNSIATVGQSNFWIEYGKFHNSDTASVCLGLKPDFTTIEPFTYIPFTFTWASTNNNPLTPTNNQDNSSTELVFTATPPCIQKANCDTVKLHGIAASCDINQDFTFTAFKNKECGAKITWQLDPSVIQTWQTINDTTLRIRFNKEWQGWIYAQIETSCGTLKDSMLLTLTASPGAVNLGADKELCTGNTITLNAHKGYASYRWNDGSSDSLLAVAAPGKYWVDVTDACGNFSNDTIYITAAAPIPFSIGADRSKCNADTLQLAAPSGFLNYTWGPLYNISSVTNQQVIVQPAVDTIYYVKAEKTSGCFANDTLRITVNHSLPINLGNDKSFCSGDSAVLDAGTAFTNYEWSTGSTGRSVTVKTAGTYAVKATAANSCVSVDTLKVISVWNNPVINLDKTNTLCTGSMRTLSPGVYNSYNWQDGSSSPAFTVNSTGTYYVTVTDQNNCKGSDTVRITNLLPLPSAFLPIDTPICNYGNITLIPNQNFNTYQWNNGSRAESITIDKAGIYWLEVKDNNQCTGRDSITVTVKECLKGLYVPTGFTPDNNGLNDILKPIIGGTVLQYKFTVYNRGGEIVFSTTDPVKGWDGKVKGMPQDSQVLVWTCRYQLQGEGLRLGKGTVLLIR